MKTKLLLLSIAAVVTVSADCQAMLRRAPVKMAAPRAQRASMPRVQRVPQRSMSIAKNQVKLQHPYIEYFSPLTEIASERLQGGLLHTHSKYQELLAQKKALGSELVDLGLQAGLLGLPALIIPAAVAIATHNPEIAKLSAPAVLMVSGAAGYDLGFFDVLKQRSNVREELAALVRDQKHQLTNPEDKQ